MRATDIPRTAQSDHEETESCSVWICGPGGEALSLPDSCPGLIGTPLEVCRGPEWVESLHPEDLDAVVTGWKECLAAGTPWRCNYRIRDPDGEYRAVASAGVPVRDTAGRVLFWVGINVDLIGRTKNSGVLRAVSSIVEWSGVSLDETLRVAAAVLPAGWLSPEDAAVRITVEGREYLSPDFTETPWRRESPILVRGRTVGKVEVYCRHERCLDGGGPVLADGRRLIDAVGARLGRIVEQVQAAAVSEERYRFLYEQMLESYTLYEVVRDSEGNPVDYRIVELNEKAAGVFCRGREELVGRRLFDVFPAISEGARDLYGEVAERGAPMRRRLQEPGSGRWYDLYIFRPEAGRLAVVGQEITGQKKAEQALRESEERFRGIFEQAGTGIALIDPEEWIREVNPAFVRIFGYSEEELCTMRFVDLVHPAEREDAGDILGESVPREGRYVTKDGRTVWGRLTTSPLRDREGRELVIAMVEDVTGRREMQNALLASEERFRMIAQRNFDMIFICHAERGITYISPAVTRILGYAPEEMTGRRCREYLIGKTLPGWQQMRRRVARGESVEGFIVEFRRKDGTAAAIEMNCSPITEDGVATGVQVVGRDVSDRRRHEALRLQAFEQIEQNIEQFAVLADHIRLPLQVILGTADLLDDGPASEKIRAQVERINGIVKQLDEGWVESREIREFLRRNELV
ncbi:PAS domain S-box protein [Methanoculleus sp. Wushi-C6]|uniref:histidine kinase n=1 Tax=Methanoculleus caldifontis TaxID=2651577 RepID=A0ABU3X2Y9_9EURY|nr:PAS domain S-box protein [Methanoculleus sp. Wushi-C6]MDV2482135.1 PAS domain S-box protein [Methanoculleus sp. Wushi-C6]